MIAGLSQPPLRSVVVIGRWKQYARAFAARIR
jgi:hypothetical protein